MSSLRRKTTRVEPLAVIGTALVSTPVSSVAVVTAASFSDVLVKTGSGARKIGDAFEQVRPRAAAPAMRSVRPLAYPLWNNDGTDLYDQLDTLLREKSMLIAVV